MTDQADLIYERLLVVRAKPVMTRRLRSLSNGFRHGCVFPAEAAAVGTRREDSPARRVG